MRAPAPLLLLALTSALRPASSVPLMHATTPHEVRVDLAVGKTACPYLLKEIKVGNTVQTEMFCHSSPAQDCCRKDHECVQLYKVVNVPEETRTHRMMVGCACMDKKTRLALDPSPPHT